MVERRVMASFDLDMEWFALFYELERSSRPVPKVTPNVVPVLLRDDELHDVWSPRRARRAKAAPKAAPLPPLTLPDAEDALESDESAAGEGDAEGEGGAEHEAALDAADLAMELELEKLLEELDAERVEFAEGMAESAGEAVAVDETAETAAPLAEELPPLPAPPLPPPAPAPGVRQRRKPNTAHFAGGRVTYYRSARFEAECGNPLHGRCVLTRKRLSAAAHWV